MTCDMARKHEEFLTLIGQCENAAKELARQAGYTENRDVRGWVVAYGKMGGKLAGISNCLAEMSVEKLLTPARPQP